MRALTADPRPVPPAALRLGLVLLLSVGVVATPPGAAAQTAADARPAPPAEAAPAGFDAARRAFAAEVAREQGAGRAAPLADARYQQGIIDAITRPFEAKPWPAYRRLFLTPERIDGGVAFLDANAALLARAEAAFGVPPAIVVAILGIETNYGRRLGDWRVLDALATLGFAYPPRAAFFRGELAEFLRLVAEESIDPRTAQGSYAGALGQPQFIPSSYRNYAVDFDGDGRRDLWASNADVIGSVANYLAQHGWRRGEPLAAPARLTRGRPRGVAIGGQRPLAPNTTVAALAAAGVQPAPPPGAPDPGAARPAALLWFDGDDYLLAFDNFYAITRYNHSNLYARAVVDLATAIDVERAAARQPTGETHDHDHDRGGAPG